MRRYRIFNIISKIIQVTPMISKPKRRSITSLTNMSERSIHKDLQLLNLPNNIKDIQAKAWFLQNLKPSDVKTQIHFNNQIS
ncbi:hypothetical protein MA16_Dca010889 [Dendrobium catenatum]|uniref:Uncharacterized protein n=1 Tax=Dendrobium catenatum TaxID=906689 RepID=A0A2I0X7C2_9ASPA|nr:hypothetical protein MA16_Dca010889 [Dendrobium catenatum]